MADTGRFDYATRVLRRTASLVALLAVIAAPVPTTTRFFCQYTGEEIVGCAESGVPQQAQFRGEQCCNQRTFRALDGVRLAEDQRPQAPVPVAIGAATVLRDLVAIAFPAVQPRVVVSTGPPAFLSHRALLI